MESIPNWSDLPRKGLIIIAKHMLSESVEDFMAFKGVCKPWRAAATADGNIFVKYWPSVPLIMVEYYGERIFYSLSKKKICMRSPLSPSEAGRRCIGAGFGWVLTCSDAGKFELLNPFTRAHLDLPSFDNVPEYGPFAESNGSVFLRRAVLSASPDPESSSSFVIMVLSTMGDYLGFWRPGDRVWTRVHPRASHRVYLLFDVNYYRRNEKFYAVDAFGRIFVWDVAGPDLTTAHFIFDVMPSLAPPRETCLVESSTGELLLVYITSNDPASKSPAHVFTSKRVIQLDVMKRKWENARDLENDAIFVGYNASFSIPASSDPNVIQPDSIYSVDAYTNLPSSASKKGGGQGEKGEAQAGKGVEKGKEEEEAERKMEMVWIAPSQF